MPPPPLAHGDSGRRARRGGLCRRGSRCWACSLVVAVASLVVLTLLLVAAALLQLGHPRGPEDADKCDRIIREWPSYQRGAVASDATQCSIVGRDILKVGGSAVDASIATLFCTSLMNPHSMGLGGGVIFTIYNPAGGETEVIMARERAPRNLPPSINETLCNRKILSMEPLAIGVPGELRAYALAHRRHGRLPWHKLLEPSIQMARNGVPVSRELAEKLTKIDEVVKFKNDSEICALFCWPNGTVKKENDIVRYPALARTLETIAREGEDALYNGSLATLLVEDVRAKGGVLSLEDLRSYHAEIVKPLMFSVGKYTLVTPAPPGGGAILTSIVNALSAFHMQRREMKDTEGRALDFHHMVEVLKFAYAQHRELADPEFENMAQKVQELMSPAYGEKLRQLIQDDRTHERSFYTPTDPDKPRYGTSHLSVLAEDGGAVSVTSSINLYFGSQVVSNRTGIILNDQMSDFSCPQAGKPAFNFIEPWKRPISFMSPSLLLDEHRFVKMVIGASGGSKITAAIAQVLANVLWLGYDLPNAVCQPRLYINQGDFSLQNETGFNEAIKLLLEKKSHVFKQKFPSVGVVQAIWREDGAITAVSDARKYSMADGY
ncbi:glutathione hydrolase 1 proenzyme-like [Lampetra fluviatilis]